MFEAIGWIGATCLALCALPQIIKSHKEKHADGVSWGLLSLWYLGEWATLVYVIAEHGFDIILLSNYLLNILFISIIIWYKWPKKQ